MAIPADARAPCLEETLFMDYLELELPWEMICWFWLTVTMVGIFVILSFSNFMSFVIAAIIFLSI